MQKTNYTLKESAITFIFTLIAVFSVSIFMSNLLGVISATTQTDVAIVATYSWINYLNMGLSSLVFVLVYIILNGVKKKDFVVASKLKFKFDLKIFFGVVVLAAVVMFASINSTGIFNYAFSKLTSKTLTNSLAVSMNTFWEFLIVVLLLAVMPAICEELIFRGIIYNGLRQKFSALFSILISAGLFTLIHFSIYQTFFQFILGVVLALIVHYTGNIVYGMIYHFVNNFIIILFNYVSPNKALFEFTTWGAKEIILSIVFMLIGAAVAYLFFKILKNYAQKHKNYFKIEITNEPLEEVLSDEEKLEKQNVDVKKLSSYDKKLLLNEEGKFVSDKGLLFIGFGCALLIWSFNSFGGFI